MNLDLDAGRVQDLSAGLGWDRDRERAVDAWVQQMFLADQAMNGGIVRRSVDDVSPERLADIKDYARQREWHVLETGGQIVVLCHQGDLTIHL